MGIKDVRYGSSITIPGNSMRFEAANSVDVVDWTQNANPMTSLLEFPATRLFDHEYDTRLMGSWCLTITAIPDTFPADTVGIVPLEAVITLGSGGVTHQIVTDVYPSVVIPIPTTSLYVAVRWKRMAQNAIGFPFSPPINTVVKATVHRGVMPSRAFYSVIWPNRNAGIVNRSVRIPPLAESFMPRGIAIPPDPLYNVVTEYHFITGRLAGTVAELGTILGTTMLAILNAGDRYRVPSQADSVNIVLSGLEGNPWSTEFRLIEGS